jgi:malate synthase
MITEEGLRQNIRVGVQYIEAWLSGNGCVPLYNLMEDAATAEISRSQIWQWITHKASFTDTNKTIDEDLFTSVLDQEMNQLIELRGDSNFDQANLDRAIDLFKSMSTSSEFDQFLTLPAYNFL